MGHKYAKYCGVFMGQAGLPLELRSPLEVTFEGIFVPTVGTLSPSVPAADT